MKQEETNKTPGPGYGRVPDHIIEDRVSQVYDWMLSGWPRHKMVAEGKKLWDVLPRAVDEYIAKAKALFYEMVAKDREEAYSKHLARLEHLYSECVKNKDRRTAAQVTKQIAELQNLLTQRVDVTTNGQSVNKITIEIVDGAKDKGEQAA